MKKFNFFLIAFVSILCFNTVTVKAETAVLKTGYYTVKPKLNTNLQISISSNNITLGYIDKNLQKLEFFYIPSKDAYVINNQFGIGSLKWTGELGLGNLKWAEQDISDDCMLWTLKQSGENEYIIANKKDPSMVFDVDNYDAVFGKHIKLEKQHEANSPYIPAQVFVIEY